MIEEFTKTEHLRRVLRVDPLLPGQDLPPAAVGERERLLLLQDAPEYTEEMQPFHIVVCGSIVPDPLQTLEPVRPGRAALKNEMMLPAVLDPWAAHALYEAAASGEARSRAARSGWSASAPRPSSSR